MFQSVLFHPVLLLSYSLTKVVILGFGYDSSERDLSFSAGNLLDSNFSQFDIRTAAEN